MADRARPMVLRSVNLPPEMDDELRTMAFALRCPKADLIRFFIDRGMKAMVERLGPKPSDRTIQDVVSELEGVSEADRTAIDRDIDRIRQYVERNPRLYAAR